MSLKNHKSLIINRLFVIFIKDNDNLFFERAFDKSMSKKEAIQPLNTAVSLTNHLLCFQDCWALQFMTMFKNDVGA